MIKVLSFTILFGIVYVTDINSQNKELKENLYEGFCDCFNTASPDQDIYEKCMGSASEVYLNHQADMLKQFLIENEIDPYSDLTYTEQEEKLMEEWSNNLLVELTGTLILKCDAYGEVLTSMLNEENLLEQIAPFDSATASEKLPIYNELINSGLGDSYNYFKRGTLFLSTGELDKAINDFRESKDRDSTKIDYQKVLGLTLIIHKKYTEAELLFKKMYSKTGDIQMLILSNLMQLKNQN